MKKYIFVLFSFLMLASAVLSAPVFRVAGENPHDSLIFDGSGSISFLKVNVSKNCFIKVIKAEGTSRGRAIKKELSFECGREPESVYDAQDTSLNSVITIKRCDD